MSNGSMRVVENFIDGHSVATNSDEVMAVINPSTGEPIADVGASTKGDVDAAVRAASRAFREWSGLTPSERSRRLHLLADLFERELSRFADLEVLDTGKPCSSAHDVEFPAIADALRHFAGAARMSTGQTGADFALGHSFYLQIGRAHV